METGLREWLIIGGCALVVLIIADGWRRMRKGKNQLKMDIEAPPADISGETANDYNPELPNGGARPVAAVEPVSPDSAKQSVPEEPAETCSVTEFEPSLAESTSEQSAESPLNYSEEKKGQNMVGLDTSSLSVADLADSRLEPTFTIDPSGMEVSDIGGITSVTAPDISVSEGITASAGTKTPDVPGQTILQAQSEGGLHTEKADEEVPSVKDSEQTDRLVQPVLPTIDSSEPLKTDISGHIPVTSLDIGMNRVVADVVVSDDTMPDIDEVMAATADLGRGVVVEEEIMTSAALFEAIEKSRLRRRASQQSLDAETLNDSVVIASEAEYTTLLDPSASESAKSESGASDDAVAENDVKKSEGYPVSDGALESDAILENETPVTTRDRRPDPLLQPTAVEVPVLVAAPENESSQGPIEVSITERTDDPLMIGLVDELLDDIPSILHIDHQSDNVEIEQFEQAYTQQTHETVVEQQTIASSASEYRAIEQQAEPMMSVDETDLELELPEEFRPQPSEPAMSSAISRRSPISQGSDHAVNGQNAPELPSVVESVATPEATLQVDPQLGTEAHARSEQLRAVQQSMTVTDEVLASESVPAAFASPDESFVDVNSSSIPESVFQVSEQVQEDVSPSELAAVISEPIQPVATRRDNTVVAFPERGRGNTETVEASDKTDDATAAMTVKGGSLSHEPEPENVLVMTVVSGNRNGFNGQALLKLLLACGMRFGEMEIFHRFEDGIDSGAVQFSMANATGSGVFDLNRMSDINTRAVTFFMSMEEPREVMNAFECMLATAETLARHLEGELVDDNRMVMRPQTQEHYRQRVRDYEMRNLHQRCSG
ncbi:MAG: cell division protein ZipA [Marinobacterium sp.]|nr:cell division protein ZipA [Marinobacterium sp.]